MFSTTPQPLSPSERWKIISSRFNVPQHSPEWLKWHDFTHPETKGTITASTAADILSLGYKSAKAIYEQHVSGVKKTESAYVQAILQAGLDAEREIFFQYRNASPKISYWDDELFSYVSADEPWLSASPDAVVCDGGVWRLVELKHSVEVFPKPGWIIQVMIQMHCFQFPLGVRINEADIVILNKLENQLMVYRVSYSPGVMTVIYNECVRFRQAVENKSGFAPIKKDYREEIVKLLNSNVLKVSNESIKPNGASSPKQFIVRKEIPATDSHDYDPFGGEEVASPDRKRKITSPALQSDVKKRTGGKK